MKLSRVLIASLFFVLASCGDKASSSRSKAEEASHKAKPGSYEDWCEEHQVPESLDTQCNPSLIAAFKASGDWCDEHQMPESQCKKCNPNLKIERPPKE
jgi:hypothetical protein